MPLDKVRPRSIPKRLARAPSWPLLRLASADKLVASRALNLLGGQLLRILVAHGIHRALRSKPAGAIALYCEELERNGILKIEEFLDVRLFERLRHLALSRMNDPELPRATHHHGPTRVEHLDVGVLPEADRDLLRPWLTHPELMSVISWAERRKLAAQHGSMIIERVTYGDCAKHDPETVLHSDIFFPTHKVWLYLTDVGPDDGPLVYVERSHRLSLPRLRREYGNSVGARSLSRRIAAEELTALGLHEHAFTVPRNTLVVADTSGYHRRSVACGPRERLALHMSFRFNPFARGTPRVQPPQSR